MLKIEKSSSNSLVNDGINICHVAGCTSELPVLGEGGAWYWRWRSVGPTLVPAWTHKNRQHRVSWQAASYLSRNVKSLCNFQLIEWLVVRCTDRVLLYRHILPSGAEFDTRLLNELHIICVYIMCTYFTFVGWLDSNYVSCDGLLGNSDLVDI